MTHIDHIVVVFYYFILGVEISPDGVPKAEIKVIKKMWCIIYEDQTRDLLVIGSSGVSFCVSHGLYGQK
jgi:hypothetical protein